MSNILEIKDAKGKLMICLSLLCFVMIFTQCSSLNRGSGGSLVDCQTKTFPLAASPWITRLVDGNKVLDLQKHWNSNREPTVHFAVNGSYQGEYKIPATLYGGTIQAVYEYGYGWDGKGGVEQVLKPKVKACDSWRRLDSVPENQSVISNHR